MHDSMNMCVLCVQAVITSACIAYVLGCNYVLHSTGQLFSHKRKHECREYDKASTTLERAKKEVDPILSHVLTNLKPVNLAINKENVLQLLALKQQGEYVDLDDLVKMSQNDGCPASSNDELLSKFDNVADIMPVSVSIPVTNIKQDDSPVDQNVPATSLERLDVKLIKNNLVTRLIFQFQTFGYQLDIRDNLYNCHNCCVTITSTDNIIIGSVCPRVVSRS